VHNALCVIFYRYIQVRIPLDLSPRFKSQEDVSSVAADVLGSVLASMSRRRRPPGSVSAAVFQAVNGGALHEDVCHFVRTFRSA
jgi:hypothetical protein